VAGSIVVSAPGVNQPGTSLPDIVRLLETPLTPTLLGERLTLDFYARNGFRFLCLPAWIDNDILAAKWQQYRGLVRLDPKRASAVRIPTIRDGHMDAEAALTAVARLENPRHRLVAELFWPHVSDREIQLLRTQGGLATPAAIKIMSPDGAVGTARIQHMHAQALVTHCMALEKELDYLESGAPELAGLWEAAIKCWRELLANDEFWAYMLARVNKLDDHRLQKEDLVKAHDEVAAIILGIHEAFAETYAARQRFTDCVRHLQLILNSGFSEGVVRAATWSTVKKVAGTRLDDLLRRTTEIFDGVKERVDRGNFEKLAASLIDEAREIHALLSRRLEVPDEFLEQSTFDHIAEKMHHGINTKIKYEGDQRERNILYSSLMNKRLLSLPLSAVLRRKIETSIREDGRILYSRFGIDASACPDPTKCFFLEGADADPEASLIIEFYRITNREVTVDRIRRSAGVRVSYQMVKLLIPRSKLAASVKSGPVQVEILEAEYTPQQREAAAEIRAIEQQAKSELAALEHERDAAIAREDRRLEEELRAIRQRNQAKQAPAEAELKKVRQNQDTELGGEESIHRGKVQQCEADFMPQLEAARPIAEAGKNALSGFMGFLLVEAPAIAIISLIIWLLWNGYSIVISVVLSVALGKAVRKLMRGRGERRLRRIEQAHDMALEAIESDWERRKEAIEKVYAPRRKPMEEVLARIAGEEEAARRASKEHMENLNAEWNKKHKGASADFEQRIKNLRSKLVKSGTVKDMSQKTQFAAYVAARQKGYKEGKEPSSWEMQMTESETTQARLRLMMS